MLLFEPHTTFVPKFDETRHIYTNNDGLRIPSVTQLMRPISYEVYQYVPKELLAERARFGTAVHACTEYDDKGILDPESVLEEWKPRLEAWRKFKQDRHPEFVLNESRISCRTYAGTLDRVAIIDNEEWVIDIKTTSEIHAMAGIQLAAYECLVRDLMSEGKELRRAVVQLNDDANYVLREFTGKDDYQTFASLLQIYSWKTRNAR